MDTKALKYPNKSHRKVVRLPENCVELAEFMGIMAGDGGINNNWQFTITINSTADASYAIFIQSLMQRLFDVKIRFLERERHTLKIVCSSVNLLDFLISKGFPRGHKINLNIGIPEWIANRPTYERSFVRGLVDTDGCLFIHTHKVAGKEYHNLGFCLASYSPQLLKSVARILAKNDIEPHITKNLTHIYLYKVKSVVKYLEMFGTSNPRISSKFEEWKGRIVA